VIWSPDDPFSVGADLQAMLPLFMSGGVSAIGAEEKKMQDALMRLKYAQVPTVAAVSGMALGGGCELLLHTSKRVAHLESYIGLVEVGVGLIPGAGGLKEGALRGAQAAQAAGMADVFPFIKNWFLNAAMANVSKSALEARQMGYLAPTDTIVFNTHELLKVAVNEAAALHAAGYRPPLAPRGFPVAGRTGHGDDQGAAGQHARRRLHQRARLLHRQLHRGSDVRRRRRVVRAGRRAMVARSRAQVLHAARQPSEVAGTDDGHDADRKTGPELRRSQAT
jgi:enoyl-CoA hydratase/carnithine racemase